MTPKLKKIVAREGLTLLAFLVIGIVIYFISVWLHNISMPKILIDNDIVALANGIPIKATQLADFWFKIKDIGLFIGLGGGYIIYLIIRFLIWAVRTLKIPNARRNKCIIAKEGIFIIVFLLLGFILMFTGEKIRSNSEGILNRFTQLNKIEMFRVKGKWYSSIKNKEGGDFTEEEEKLMEQAHKYKKKIDLFDNIELFGTLLFLCYPIYWLIRFIIWAIKILKER